MLHKVVSIHAIVEDIFMEATVRETLRRVLRSKRLEMDLTIVSNSGGYGAAKADLRRYVDGLRRGYFRTPQIVLVGVDANSRGVSGTVAELRPICQPVERTTVYCIPDPYAESWLVVDHGAFRTTFGVDLRRRQFRRTKDAYKQYILDEMERSGQSALLGGIEFLPEYFRNIDLYAAMRANLSFRRYARDLIVKLNTIRSSA